MIFLLTDIYSLSKYYDIAFDFRNITVQADFLEEVFATFSGRPVESVIELACGPAWFVLEFTKRKKVSLGLDISSEMIEYAREKISFPVELINGDMIDFTLSKPVDMALLMMDSISHILNQEDFLKHLKSVAQNLTEGGIYFLECSHPSDVILEKSKTACKWISQRDGISVETIWGLDTDITDPITQITDTTVTLNINDNGMNKQFIYKIPQKSYLVPEIRALVELSGVFHIASCYGDFNINSPLDNSDKSWRMNLVLKKI